MSSTSSQNKIVTAKSRLSQIILNSVEKEPTKDNIHLAEIQEKLEGKMVAKVIAVPSSKLTLPKNDGNVRLLDTVFVEILKQTMIKKPTATYLPLVVNVVTTHAKEVILANLQNYSFEVIGGNHSRQAVQEILLRGDHPKFRTRLCRVYKNLTQDESDWV